MSKIQSLTKKQTDSMPAFRDEYIAKGLSIEPIDHDKAIATIYKCYECAGLKKPKSIEFVQSPLALIERGAELMGKAGDKQTRKNLRDQLCYGQHDAGWLSFYSFFREKLGLKKETDKAAGLIEGVDTLHWWLPFDEACLISERPLIQKIENGMLHSENGPAIQYSDGFSIYRMWGVSVPAWIADTSKEKLDVAKVMALSAVDQRTVGLRKIGLHNIKDYLKVKVLDTFEDYELWSIEIENRKVGPYLKMVGPTTGEIHVEGVGSIPGEFDLTINTCQKAIISRMPNSVFKEYKEPLFKA